MSVGRVSQAIRSAVPALPLRGWILLGSLLAFAVAVLSVLAWAQFTGRAGSQRGLVIHNALSETIRVSISPDTRLLSAERLGALQFRNIGAGEEETFVVRREQFPAVIAWTASVPVPLGDASFTSMMLSGEQEVAYKFLVDAEFRISIDENGLYPTTDYRDTPVAAR
jgi:hypothetical protein